MLPADKKDDTTAELTEKFEKQGSVDMVGFPVVTRRFFLQFGQCLSPTKRRNDGITELTDEMRDGIAKDWGSHCKPALISFSLRSVCRR